LVGGADLSGGWRLLVMIMLSVAARVAWRQAKVVVACGDFGGRRQIWKTSASTAAPPH
jgi:hypothetical protein